jgi:hypothetical protein
MSLYRWRLRQDVESAKLMGTEGAQKGHIGRFPPTGDQTPSLRGNVVRRVEHLPAITEAPGQWHRGASALRKRCQWSIPFGRFRP